MCRLPACRSSHALNLSRNSTAAPSCPTLLAQLRRDKLIRRKQDRRVWNHPQHMRRQSSIQRRAALFLENQLERLHEPRIFLHPSRRCRLTQTRAEHFVRVRNERRDRFRSRRRTNNGSYERRCRLRFVRLSGAREAFKAFIYDPLDDAFRDAEVGRRETAV